MPTRNASASWEGPFKGGGFEITRVGLSTRANVPGIEDGESQKVAAAAKEGCPVSKALAGPEISLEASLA
jgi:lipoyl-dependent peroxiredoxin